ncbi:hypothetical protein ACFCYN_20230 [Gottfriedia sp. NPDC056225]|uniref:hypothetical protein n=1 Tax=Gottfriedia sp. NPDC056225 TaxID=3345751 RepID=UPI0035DA21FD
MVFTTIPLLTGFSTTESSTILHSISNHDHFNLLNSLNDFFSNISSNLHDKTSSLLDRFEWIQNGKKMLEQLNEWSKKYSDKDPLKSLIMALFSLLEKVIYTPVFLFNNAYFTNLLLKFGALSMGLITSLTMLEGLKRILNKSTMSYRQLLQRLPIVMALTGFAPLLIVEGMKLLSYLTNLILQFGVSLTENVNPLGERPVTGLMDTILYVAFVILFGYNLVPILLSHGRRWFNVLSLTLLTPIAMLGYLFPSFHPFHQKWWASLKKNYLSQLYYSSFLSVLNIIMFGISTPDTYQGVFSKLLILLGGIHVFSQPPAFLNSYMQTKPDVYSSVAQVQRSLATNPTALLWKAFRKPTKAKT